MKKILCMILIICLFLTACSDIPELLEPLGFEENLMEVKRGDMYNIKVTENVVIRETSEIIFNSDAIIKNVNVSLGDEVKAGDVIFALDGASVSSQAAEIDERIENMKKDNEYLDSLKEINIQIAQAELEKLQAQGAGSDAITAKQEEITQLQNAYYQARIDEEQALSELTMQKMNAGNVDSDIKAPFDGVVMYLSNLDSASVSKGTVAVILGKADTKIIQGDYVEELFIDSCDEYYALIEGKRYDITNHPLDANQLSLIDVFGGILQNTYYINTGEEEIPYGAGANVVFISDRKEDILYIPDDGIYEDVDGYYVYIKDEDGNKIRRNVEVGTIWETAVEIVSGLEEGEIIYGK